MDSNPANNPPFELAYQLVVNSRAPIFLTGKAGTGKTTFLKHVKRNCQKNMVIVAPTGVAAINAGGTTIHSFFSLPFGPYLPDKKNNTKFRGHSASKDTGLFGKIKVSNEKKAIIAALDLLIIDEISMVRADVLDAIDAVLRHFRNNHTQPFGGVQVLYIGDVYQLAPVAREDEWQLLSRIYDSPYFFSSRVFKEQSPFYIELEKVYRQNDDLFIALLNAVRNNEMDEAGYELLHERMNAAFEPGDQEQYITLTTHNQTADAINRASLEKIKEKQFEFRATIAGLFPENNFPAEELLSLKVGAKVMFIKNDSEKIRRFFNGKIGFVTRIEDDKIIVSCDDDAGEIPVMKETWENIRYQLNPGSKQIEEEVLGTFSQFPLRLAWAITIHKSQGLSFEKVIVDAGRAFAPGQVYVALSRCTNLSGLVLRSAINPQSMLSDPRIVRFTHEQSERLVDEQLSQSLKRSFESELMRSVFYFGDLLPKFRQLENWNKQYTVFAAKFYDWLRETYSLLFAINSNAAKFNQQLQHLYEQASPDEINVNITPRLRSAAAWFEEKLSVLRKNIEQVNFATDNQARAGEYATQLKRIHEKISFALHMVLFAKQSNSFSSDAFFKHKRSFAAPYFYVQAYAGYNNAENENVAHPVLFQMLRALRSQLADQHNVPLYLVCSTSSLEQMANCLPSNARDLEKLGGFGPVKLNRYGEAFTSLIAAYCERNHIEPPGITAPVEKKVKSKTKKIKEPAYRKTVSIFNEGKDIGTIATERSLAVSTVESHLALGIKHGEIPVSALVIPTKQQRIMEIIKRDFTSVGAIKRELANEDISYGEIRWVLATINTALPSAL